ncbi:meiotic recombination protein Rec8p [Monosporozyma unispora]|nr:hypothetical protein C6P44_000314 [Kazachstania unispora]
MFLPLQVNIDKNKKHSLTTVWLLSLLNKRQINVNKREAVAKVSKKNIIEVSIPETCRLLQKEDYKIPLKQVSHMLYGVSLCYTKKTDFVLEELSHLLTQLQRSQSVTEKLNMTERKYLRYFGVTQELKHVGEIQLYEDDPSFDINNIIDFEFFISNQTLGNFQKLESVKIKKKDLLSELNNVNIITEENSGFSDIHTINRNFTLEELPADFALDLDIGDIISQQGTSRSSSSNNYRNDPEFHFQEERRHSISMESHSNNEMNPVMDFDLEIEPNTGDEPENSEDLNGGKLGKGNNKEERKRKLAWQENKGRNALKKVKVDVRISLLTETLKNNYDSYLEKMDRKREKIEGKSNKNLLKIITVQTNKTKLLGKCWTFTFSQDLRKTIQDKSNLSNDQGRFHMDSIDMGRRAIDISGTNNLFMDEGDQFFTRQEGRLTPDVLFPLEQISEELHEEEQGPGLLYFENNSDFMKQPLNLPSSSYSRSTTRTASENTNEGKKDFIDILKMSKGTEQEALIEVVPTLEPFFDSASKKIKKIQNQQAVKFYSYLCSRYEQLKQETRDSQEEEVLTTTKKLPFDYLIPTTVEDYETRTNIRMTKKLAANAFFSLLDLASQEIIEFATPTSKPFPVCFDNFSIIL